MLPFLAGMGFAYYVFGWDTNAAKIAGIVLPTTSVAVVYAVMVESGLSSTKLGQSILAACFVTDLGTILALGVLFTGFSIKLIWFIGVLLLAMLITTPLAAQIFTRFSGEVREPLLADVISVVKPLEFSPMVDEVDEAYQEGDCYYGELLHFVTTILQLITP